MSTRKSRIFTGCLVSFLVALIGLPILALYLTTSGSVYGTEFSPADFSRRSFFYNVSPWFNITIRGISYDDTTPVFEQMLISDGLIQKTKLNRWDLIDDSGYQNTSQEFDARFLTSYLDMVNEENECIWIVWNEQHPQTAKSFWPLIADLARSNIYWAIPEIMRRAIASKTESADLASEFETAAAEAFFDEAKSAQSDGQHQRAIELFSKSIQYFPTRKAYLSRSESYSESGDATASRQDRESAKNVAD